MVNKNEDAKFHIEVQNYIICVHKNRTFKNRVLLKRVDCRSSVNVRVNPEKLTLFLNKN